MRSVLLSVMLSLAAFAGTARAEEPPAAPAAPAAAPAAPAAKAPNPLAGLDGSPYYYDQTKPGKATEAGERFLADLKAKDPALWAAVNDRVRYMIQDDESKKFVHQRKFVIAAYAVLWSILVIFVVGMWQRQRKLSAELAQLEARLRAEAK